MVEWFKAHAWKACDVNASAGSNPVLCAKRACPSEVKSFDLCKLIVGCFLSIIKNFLLRIDLGDFFCYSNVNIRKSIIRFCNPKGFVP